MSRDPSAETALLADVGGTNARFALIQDGTLGSIMRLKTGDFSGPVDAIEAFLSDAAPGRRPERVALAVAGPVTGENARLTNGVWSFCGEELRLALGFTNLKLVNDFAAVALALPHLTDGDLTQIGAGKAVRDAPWVVLGPGTGLGVAALLSPHQDPIVIASEGGHVSLAAHDELEAAILAQLRAKMGHVAAEDVLSGKGLVRVYNEIGALRGLATTSRCEKDITRAALSGDCQVCGAALDLFCGLLGRFAGDLALVFGAQGGVYLAGGIVPSIEEYLIESTFRACFEDKGLFADYLRNIPTVLVTRPDPAFLGLAALVADD